MAKYGEAMERWSCFYPRFEGLCERFNVTPQQVGKKINVSPSTISSWKADWYGDFESQRSQPSVASIISLSVYFRCTTDYLIGTRVNWRSVRINRVIDSLSEENQEKLLEYANLLFLKQEHDKENK